MDPNNPVTGPQPPVDPNIQPQPNVVPPTQPIAQPEPVAAPVISATQPVPQPMAAPAPGPVPVQPPGVVSSPQPNVGMGGVPAQPAQNYPMPADPNKKSKKRLIMKIVLGIVGIITLGLFAIGFVSGLDLARHKQETKVGVDFITAVQDKDLDKVLANIAPDYKEIIDRTVKLVGSEYSKDDLFAQSVGASFKNIIPSGGEAKAQAIDVTESNGTKYAVVRYSIGDKKATVLEIYDNDKPYVLEITEGQKELSKDTFDDMYKEYKDNVATYKKQLDLLESTYSGQSSLPAININ